MKIKELESLVTAINEITGNNTAEWTRKDGKTTANIGNYHLDGAYGGYALYQMMNEGGGVHDISSMGHQSKRELGTFLHGFLGGLQTAINMDAHSGCLNCS